MKTKKEQWMPIVRYETKYEISSHGRVRNFETGEYLKAYAHSKGYLRVTLSRKKNIEIGKRVADERYVHRLVANHFVPNPYNKPQVNHVDGDKKHNNSEHCFKHNFLITDLVTDMTGL